MALDISITKADSGREVPPDDKLGFGQIFTDHMFVMGYKSGKGWHDPLDRLEGSQADIVDAAVKPRWSNLVYQRGCLQRQARLSDSPGPH